MYQRVTHKTKRKQLHYPKGKTERPRKLSLISFKISFLICIQFDLDKKHPKCWSGLSSSATLWLRCFCNRGAEQQGQEPNNLQSSSSEPSTISEQIEPTKQATSKQPNKQHRNIRKACMAYREFFSSIKNFTCTYYWITHSVLGVPFFTTVVKPNSDKQALLHMFLACQPRHNASRGHLSCCKPRTTNKE